MPGGLRSALFNMHDMKKNIDSLDGLRAFACLLVVFGHLAKEEIILDIKGSGQLGVMLFFVLSGFLMAHLYGGEKLSRSRLVEYTFRRVFRVFPAYLAALSISFLLTPYWVDFPYAMDINGFIKHLKLQGDTSVFWTIPVELKFYVFFPMLWLGLGFLPNTVFRSLVIFCLFVAAVNIFPYGERLDLSRYIEFFIGGVCAGYINVHLVDIHARLQHIINAVFVVTLVLILVFIPQVFLHLTGMIHPMWQLPQILAPLFALCVLACANATGWASAIFSNKLFLFLGKISFSLYLVHYPIIYFFNHWQPLLSLAPSINIAFIQIPLALTFAVLLAYGFYVVIESPLRRWGARLNDLVQKKIA